MSSPDISPSLRQLQTVHAENQVNAQFGQAKDGMTEEVAADIGYTPFGPTAEQLIEQQVERKTARVKTTRHRGRYQSGQSQSPEPRSQSGWEGDITPEGHNPAERPDEVAIEIGSAGIAAARKALSGDDSADNPELYKRRRLVNSGH